jgi:predicted acetyltransferase
LSETLRYRFARADEIDDLGRLIAHSFPGVGRDTAFWREHLATPAYGGGPETLLVGEDAKRVVAALQLHPLRQWIAGVRLQNAGVGTVTIAPTHRRRRLAAQLMLAALRAAKERGDVVSSLFPFRMSFYEQLGYGQCDVAHQFQVVPTALRDSPERARIELLDNDAARADALLYYNEWARTQNGQLERTEQLWQRLLDAPDRALFGWRGDDGTLQGYAIVSYRADQPNVRILDAEEVAWSNTAARAGLYAWLASLGDQWPQLLIRALPSQRLGEWLRDPRLPRGTVPAWNLWAPAGTLMMGSMFRLVDVERAWQQRAVAPYLALDLVLDVHDAQLEDNHGRWALTIEGGQATMRRTSASAADLALDIATLSRLFIGALPPTAAVEAGLAASQTSAERLGALDAALAVPEPWTFDRF